MTTHGPPGRWVEPIDAHLVRAAARFKVAAVPELDRCRAEPMVGDVHAHAEAVLDAVSAQKPRSAGLSTIVAALMSKAMYLKEKADEGVDDTPLGESDA